MIQVSDLYIKGAKAACKTRNLYYYQCFAKPQMQEFGVNHSNTLEVLKYCQSYNMDLWSE